MTGSRKVAFALASTWLIGAVACGPALQGSRISDHTSREALDVRRDGSTRDRISAGDLANVHVTTAADAVRQLRPEFLRPGGRRAAASASPIPPAVYVNGRHAGGTDVLSLIPLGVLVEIRYLDVVAAKELFGSYCPCDAGVILVRTRS